jgi:hypothetical protein
MTLRLVRALLLASAAGCVVQPDIPNVLEPWYPPMNEYGDPILGVFEGRIPCTEPSLVGCDKVKVALVLYRDSRSNAPSTYQLARVYVATSPEGSRTVTDGAVVMTRGTKLDPQALVYQLDTQAPREFRSYWAIGDSILFMLGDDLSPLVGTASWSYVLNRVR